MKKVTKPRVTREILDCLYDQYNHRKFVHPDPLEFLYDYNDIRDREIVGIIASSLAYGRVAQILKSVSKIIDVMKPSPGEFVKRSSIKELINCFRSFKHRFTTGKEIANLLFSLGLTIKEYSSLYDCFKSGYKNSDQSIIPALSKFIEHLRKNGAGEKNSLIVMPDDGSACKRHNLFLRWMIRKDDVDPGGWDGISPSKILAPLDVHMYRICHRLGLTKRKQANMKTSIEITEAFKKFNSDDPVRYDFALTRLGIRDDAKYETVYKLCGIVENG